MATAIYSMVNSIGANVASLNSRILKIEKNTDGAVQQGVSVNQTDLSYIEKRIEEAEKHIRSLLASNNSQQNTQLDQASATIMKALQDEVKNIKASLSEINKDRVLLETALTHKFEQHVNRIFKERMESVTKEMRQYVDQSVADVKAAHVSTAQAQAQYQSTNESIEEALFNMSAPNVVDIDTVDKSMDFEIELAPKTASKRVVRKKNH